jgi:putative hydrolase
MRELLADLHTHTIASGHAYATVTELCAAASAEGLEAIGIMDHGPALAGAPPEVYFWNLRSLPLHVEGVTLLTGVEANILDDDGTLDLPEGVLKRLDVVGVGLHRGWGVASDDVDRNTAALIAAMANPLVDLVTHPGRVPVHAAAVAEAAARYGVALELNDHSWGPASKPEARERERDAIRLAVVAGASVAIGSDAHFTDRVGACEEALRVAAGIGLSPAAVVNRDLASTRAFLEGRRPRPRFEAAAG